MRLRLASLDRPSSQAVAWSVLSGGLLVVLLPLAIAVTGLFLAQSDLSASRSQQSGLAARIETQRAVLSARVEALQPQSRELQALRSPDQARNEFAQTMAALTARLADAGVQILRAGPPEEAVLDDNWTETRFLLRLQGSSDTVLTLLSTPDLSALDVVRFDLRASGEAGEIQLDAEFRLISAGGSDDPAL